MLKFYPLKKPRSECEQKPRDTNVGKVPDAVKDWGQKEKRASEDAMAGQHHWCNEHELGQILGDGEEMVRPGQLQSMGSQSRTGLGDRTTTTTLILEY